MPSLPRLTPQSLRLTHLRRPLLTTTTSSALSRSSSSLPPTTIPHPPTTTSSPSIPQNWHLTPCLTGIERSFKFKDFKQAWRFMSRVAERSEGVGHHPEWWNVYNKVTIKWTTHSAQALTDKDTAMARACDEFAEEVEPRRNT